MMQGSLFSTYGETRSLILHTPDVFLVTTGVHGQENVGHPGASSRLSLKLLNY